MRYGMRAGAARAVAMLFGLSLLLSACNIQNLTELLADLQPPPAQAAEEAAPEVDDDTTADPAADDAAGDPAEADDDSEEREDAAGSGSDQEADRQRCLNRNEHVGNLREPSRAEKRERDPAPAEEPEPADEAPAEEEVDEPEPQAEEPRAERRRDRREPAQSREGGGSGDGGGSGNGGGQAAGLSNVEQQVFDLLNAERQRAGLSPLQLDGTLVQGSREWSRRMATENFFDHDRSGNFAENIAYGYPTAAAVHDGWMNSQGHRNNRMNSRYSSYGIGVHQQGNTLYYTERFR